MAANLLHLLSKLMTGEPTLLRCKLIQLESPRIAFRIPSHPPYYTSQYCGKTPKAHGDGEGHSIMWCALTSINLRANSTSNLA